MTEERGKKIFLKLFAQIHILAFILASITEALAGLLAALFSYLFYIHFLSFLVYYFGIESFWTANKITGIKRFLYLRLSETIDGTGG